MAGRGITENFCWRDNLKIIVVSLPLGSKTFWTADTDKKKTTKSSIFQLSNNLMLKREIDGTEYQPSYGALWSQHVF